LQASNQENLDTPTACQVQYIHISEIRNQNIPAALAHLGERQTEANFRHDIWRHCVVSIPYKLLIH